MRIFGGTLNLLLKEYIEVKVKNEWEAEEEEENEK